jgi:hypothetical protein
MKRRQLVELEDLAWWPRIFRDAATDYMAASMRLVRAHETVVPLLASALARARVGRIVDLCSGAGGLWAVLLPALRAQGLDVGVVLTDKFPNHAALGAIAAGTPGVEVEASPVDALAVPARLAGFRTIFLALHHFAPDDARSILASAISAGQGIAVVEGASRTPAGLATMAGVPLAVWLVTPAIRPFRWSRLFWTYVVPVLPLAILFDGVVSVLRIYTPEDMRNMALSVPGAEAYEWDAGLLRPPGAPVGVPYLVGVPRAASAVASPDARPPSR